MRSLVVRLLALSIGVAVVSIAATTWLITRTSGESVRGAFEQTLEADGFVYQRLLAYAQGNDSWDDADTLVDALAQEVGDRVALTTADGRVLADSAASDGHQPELPPTPTAEVDARSSGMIAMAGPPFQAAGAGLAMATVMDGGSTMIGVADAFPVAGQSTVWRLSASEIDRRESLAADANQCFAAAGVESRIFVGKGGTAVVSETRLAVPSSSATPAPSSSTSSEQTATVSIVDARDLSLDGGCLPMELAAPSQATIDLNDSIVDELTVCLDEAGVEYTVTTGPDDLRAVVPTDAAEPAGRTSTAYRAYDDCFVSAQDTALAEVVAEPALVYVGSVDRFDPLSGDGWARVAAAGGGVLALAGVVTAVTGRRLTRPIRALTSAAQRMGSGDRAARVPVTGRDEVADLGRAFNTMAESIETGEETRKAMVSDIAHELRTPLSNVRGYLEAAEDGVVPIDLELVTSLREEADLLRHLVEDLQSLALADAGALRMHTVDTDAADLARQVVSAHRAAAADAGLSLTIDAPPDAENLAVRIDPTRMRQALGNLVGNAIRYTPSGGSVVVSVSADDDAIRLSVTDDGPGIPADHLDRIFDRFHRVEGSRSRDTGGSGLGLPIARSLVEAHGGTVDVTSTEASGSTFTITLPTTQTATGTGGES